MSEPSSCTGEAPFSPPGAAQPCKTWYKIFGTLTQTLPQIYPLIVIHGGPSFPHNYLLPISDLTTLYSIPTIFYDQLGCGNSTHLRSKAGDESFWTIDLFISELENLISHLGLKEYDILGHSWGGMLAAKFAAKTPTGLRRLILSNSPASMELRYQSTAEYRLELPAEIQATLSKHEKNNTLTDPEYLEAYSEFSRRHMCSISPSPKYEMESVEAYEKDTTVAEVMDGDQTMKFVNGGTLKSYSMIGECGGIEARTLLVNGYKEIASDRAVGPFWREIKKVKWVKMMNSTHSPQFEERERYLEVVGEFLVEDE